MLLHVLNNLILTGQSDNGSCLENCRIDYLHPGPLILFIS